MKVESRLQPSEHLAQRRPVAREPFHVWEWEVIEYWLGIRDSTVCCLRDQLLGMVTNQANTGSDVWVINCAGDSCFRSALPLAWQLWTSALKKHHVNRCAKGISCREWYHVRVVGFSDRFVFRTTPLGRDSWFHRFLKPSHDLCRTWLYSYALHMYIIWF